MKTVIRTGGLQSIGNQAKGAEAVAYHPHCGRRTLLKRTHDRDLQAKTGILKISERIRNLLVFAEIDPVRSTDYCKRRYKLGLNDFNRDVLLLAN